MNRKEKLRVKKPFHKYFAKSPTVMKIIREVFYKKPPITKNVCEHGRVDYKALKILSIKQANIILDLGKAILTVEKNRDRQILILEQEISSLKHDWRMCDEACDAKQQEIYDLKDSILLKREGIKRNAN
jgi:hypothetical protein